MRQGNYPDEFNGAHGYYQLFDLNSNGGNNSQAHTSEMLHQGKSPHSGSNFHLLMMQQHPQPSEEEPNDDISVASSNKHFTRASPERA